ncbi:enamine deaminase RidA (YjgF/YER057c/UK114 family) [Saccharopolyspora erythraea NRRL 2338]|uniref:Possible endoribonuclease n=2 Tax=Saccharopolyspora erythraea TaxID=1836 RepID=A4FIJ6_SACEN|nr:RidA family protein [Saccharopolyspora erythraea]EQD87853.1 endoribonuclease [Saccharopolyspora erythraea D]PFG97547.1 enamine deaminase RidA (YjgF/YER057c/UK114 family) [Saccharopolyspora erythraea NRRL 2338]QRK87717.1 RidA family protein [Saccharopolyspora erythraea]CAM03871.1 possible endoribonuclease [Saccharopolyspora erythraea NRRL 2338]
MIKRWNPSGVAAPAGRYSHLASVPADHGVVFLSGQIGAREDGSLAGPDAEAQTRQAFTNIAVLLDSLGAGPRSVVKLFTLVAGTEHLDGFRSALREVFDDWYPDGDWPAQSLAVVAALATPELAVEVEAVAAVPR